MPMAHKPHLLIRAFRRPEGVLASIFGALILLGSLLLSLPIAHTHPIEGAWYAQIIDSLFTATSAVCVTGLIVLDTGKDYTLFGQLVILTLIQLGGLGIMALGAFAMQLVGLRISFRSQAALSDMFYQKNAAANFRRNLHWIIILTLFIEAVGAGLLFAATPDDMDTASAAYISIFHSISAFCNAGFSTYTNSLEVFNDTPAFIAIAAGLIVIGGLGYTVLIELLQRLREFITGRQTTVVWSLNTRVVLMTSVILVVGGAIMLDALGFRHQSEGPWARTGHALFQSITARTAGFNTVDIGVLPACSLLWLMMLMFVGGSPGSCAGGIKTTSLAIWVARLWARLRNRDDVTIGGRRVPIDLVRRTGMLVGIAAVFNLLGITILSITELGPDSKFVFEEVLFEQISAFATVGLSTGITAQLSCIGKLWIIVSMFVGRLGPLTIALIVIERRQALIRMPQERLMIG